VTELQLHFEGPGAEEAALAAAEQLEGSPLRFIRSHSAHGGRVRGVTPELALAVTLVVALPGAANHFLQLVDRFRARSRGLVVAVDTPTVSVEVEGAAAVVVAPSDVALLCREVRGSFREESRGHKSLCALLVGMFSAEELRRFIHHHPAGSRIASQLPERASLAGLCHDAACVLEREGLVDSVLFELLAEERPDRRGAIEEVAREVLEQGST